MWSWKSFHWLDSHTASPDHQHDDNDDNEDDVDDDDIIYEHGHDNQDNDESLMMTTSVSQILLVSAPGYASV